ncbi:hypothetical protein GGR52DRAFT_4444 [Hypoxylon sp. FL1284]|nr:hypothetical protein GGR52DRAFT_4444 [Hypoxylon sp. FL1284]
MTTVIPHARSSLRRTACDRCRHSKLRCLRDKNHEKCDRCLRLELRCEVAPAKPPGRPRKVVSSPPPAPSGELLDHVDIASPQLGDVDFDPPEPTRGEPMPGELRSGMDDNQQVGTIFGQKPMPSHSHVNGWTLTSAAQSPSGMRAPDWYETSAFDAGLPPMRDPLEVHSLFTTKLDRHECIKELSQLNVDLHDQCQNLRELIDSGKIRFSTFIDHQPPPAGDGVSIAEKLLIMSQRFQQAVTNLGWVVKNEPNPPYRSATAVDEYSETNPALRGIDPTTPAGEAGCSGPIAQHDLLDTPFAFLLISCYVQMISLWETMFVHVHRRITGADMWPLTFSDPGKGIQMGQFYIFSGRLQSMFFCQAVLYFIDNIDRGLSILPEQRAQGASGLLSHPHYFNLLQKELGGQVNKGVSERVSTLLGSVERARISSCKDVGW